MKWWHWVLVVLAVLSAALIVLHFTGVLSMVTAYLFGPGTAPVEPPADTSGVETGPTGEQAT